MARMLLGFAMALCVSPASVQGQKDVGVDVISEWKTLSGHERLVRCLAFAPDGTLVSGGQDRLVISWSAEGKLLHKVDLAPGGG